MIYIRGHRADYDEWSALGNQGWSYEEVLPYFKKSENQHQIDSPYHAKGGPLCVTHRNYTNPLSDQFIAAGQELGYSINEDFNGAEQQGFGMYQVTQRNGSRCSTAKAYLHPASSRSNLSVEVNAQVQKICISEGLASGVCYQQGGRSIEVKANKEVLLCAGAYNSPQILLLSGIGDAGTLKKHQLPVNAHLPGVGKNLKDHYVFFSVFDSTYKDSLDKADKFPFIFKNLFHYLTSKQGPLTSNVGEAGAFVKSNAKEQAPDIQYHFGPCYFLDHGFGNPKKGSGYSIGGKVLVPKSSGSVSLASGHFQDAPLIDHNYLSDPDDMRKSIWGYRLAQQLGMTEAFKSYRDVIRSPDQLLTSDAEIEAHIRNTGLTLYHPTSTCRMGKG